MNKKTYLSRKVFAILVAAALIIPVLPMYAPKAQATTGNLGTMHMPVNQFAGSASATSTISFLVRAGSPDAPWASIGSAPTSSANLWPRLYYKDAGDGSFTATSTCAFLSIGYHKCTAPVKPSATTPRSFQYYLEVTDGDDTAEIGTESQPFTVAVQNTALGSSSISGRALFAMPVMTASAVSATTTIPLTSGPRNYTDSSLGWLDVNDWVYIGAGNSATSTQVTATSTNSITVSNPVSFAAGTEIHKKISDVWVFAEGTSISAQSSNSADATFGDFTLSNLAVRPYNLVGFKDGYFDALPRDIQAPLSGFSLFLGPGGGPGGGLGIGEDFGVMWSAPNQNMMGAPIDISLDRAPILIGLTQSASTTSLSLSNTTTTIQSIKIQKITSSGATDVTSSGGFQLAYQPAGSNVLLLPGNAPTSYNFGGDEKIIIYSNTALDSQSQYVVELTNNIKSSNGSSLSGSRPEGGHNLSFTTASDSSSMTNEQYGGGGQYMPPFVMNMMPNPGSFGFARDGNIVLKFSEAMDSSAINSTNIKLCKVTNAFTPSETEDCSISASVSLNNLLTDIVTIDPTSTLLASTRYRIKVLGGARSSSGITIAPPDQSSMSVFKGDFETSTSVDDLAPRVMGASISSGATGVGLTPIIELGFGEGMDPNSVKTSNVTLRAGTASVNIEVKYQYGMNNMKITPLAALSSNTSYTLTLLSGSTGIKDLAGLQLDGNGDGTAGDNYTLSFTTGGADTTAPKLKSANADNFKLAITFSEPMRSVAATDTTGKWASSVLNLSNYTVKYCASSVSDCNTSGTIMSTTSANVIYDSSNKTIEIENLQLSSAMPTAGGDYFVQIDNVADLSGNAIDGSYKTMRCPVQDSGQTFGMLGPMSGGMMGPPTTAGGEMGPMIGTNSPSMMGVMPIRVQPMNATAARTTTYFLDIPTTVALSNDSQVVLTFPAGFDVSGAIPDQYSPMRNDWNGPGAGTVIFDTAFDSDGVEADLDARTITMQLAITGTPNAQEMYHFDISGIINSSIPKDFGTSGYTVGIETKNSSGKILETMTSMPFFITEGGSRTITIGITANTGTGCGGSGCNIATSTLQVMLDSPMTGPTPATITFNGSGKTATTTFSNMTDGEYSFFTNPEITLPICNDAGCAATTSKEFFGAGSAKPIQISGSNVTKSYTLTRADGGIGPINVILNGTFKTNSVADNIDIFYSGPFGFGVKTVSTGGASAVSGCLSGVCTNASAGIYVPSAGEWYIGIGPEMPKGTQFSAPPMPDWMPPETVKADVSGSSGSPVCVENSGTANDCNLAMTVQTASSEIRGYVKDASGNAIPNVGVDAFRMSGFGSGSHAQTNSEGLFILKAVLNNSQPTSYGLNVYMPGMPPVPPKTVVVKANGALVDGNTTADVYREGGLGITTANPLVIKITKGGYTISGQVVDSADLATAKPISNASVWANNTVTGEFIPSGTDSSGNFILYVNAGTWQVSGHLPQYGDLPPVSVTVSTQSVGDVTLKPLLNKNQMAAISGTISISGSGASSAKVWIEGTDSAGRYYENGANVDENGSYSLKVPAGTYTIHAFEPDYGEIGKLTLTAIAGGTYSGRNFTVAAGSIAEITFSFTNAPSGAEGFVDVFDPETQKGQGKRIVDISSIAVGETIKVPYGDYFIRAHIPGFGEFNPTTPSAGIDGKTTLSSATTTVTFTLPTLENQITLSGQVTDGTDPLADAFVWAGNMSAGYNHGTNTDASGNYSLKIPAGAYRVGADRPGYSGPAPADVVFSTNTTRNFTLSSNSNTISGQIKNSSNAAISNAWVWAEKVTSAIDFTPAGGWAGSPSDSAGNYELSVGTGYWVVRAGARGYKETKYSSVVDGSTDPTVNITLANDTGYTAVEAKSKSIAPSQGGTLDDRNNTGVKVVVPAAALGSDTNNGSLTVEEARGLPTTSAKLPLPGKDINAYDSTNQKISSLSGTIEVEITYSEADIPVGYTESQLGLSYWDETSSQYVEVPAVVDITNNTIKADITHLSVYAPTLPSGSNPPSAPGTPTTVVNGDTSITISWATSTDDVSVAGYEVYRSESASGTYSNVSGDAEPSGVFTSSLLVTNNCSTGTCSWTDATASRGTNYYYKVSAFDYSGNQSNSSSASEAVVISTGGGGAAGSAGDNNPPQISNIQETINSTTAVISWTTNESSISSLKYGTSTSYGATELDGTYKTSHQITINNLLSETIYHYQIISKDVAGNQGSYSDKSFTTLASGEAPITTISATSATTTSATTTSSTTAAAPTLISGQTSSAWSYTFAKRMKKGDTSDEIKKLQEFLALDKEVYPKGLTTGYFGALTQNAVQKFQCKYSIACSGTPTTTGYGLVGPKTLAKLNEIASQTNSPALPIAKQNSAQTTTADTSAPTTAAEQALVATLQAQIQVLQEQLVQLLSQLSQMLQSQINVE